MPPKLNYILTSAFYCFYLVGSDFQGLAYHIPLLHMSSPSQLKILTLLLTVRHRFLEHDGVAYISFYFFLFSFPSFSSFFSLLFPFSPFLLASLLFSLFPSFCNSPLHYCTLLNLFFPFSLFSSFCLLSLLSSFSSLFSPLIPSSTLLCLLTGPLSFPSLYALFFLPSSFSSLLYPFSFSPSFTSFLFFSFLFFSLAFSLFPLVMISLVQQTSAHPATHSLSQQETEERMKNSQVKTGRSLTSYHHRQNRFDFNLIYCTLK